MAQVQHVTDRVGGGERYRRSTDDAGVEQRQREQRRRNGTDILFEPGSDASCVAELAEFRMAGKGRRS
jgi:hypothetical protein